MVSEKPVPQVLPMARSIPLPDTVLKVPDQLAPFKGLLNPRPLDI